MEPLLAVKNLRKFFPVKKGILSRTVAQVHAVNDVSFSLQPGRTLGLVGESGCGKTTVARLVVRLLDPDAGEIILEGTDLAPLGRKALLPYRQKIQMVFQDPYSSLNPRMRVGEIVAEPLMIHKKIRRAEKRSHVDNLLEKVGLKPEHYDRYPHEFSGGQRQRVGIARALALLPALVVADEPVSALDVKVASQILDLMLKLQDEMGLAYLFISHDLKVIHAVSHDVAVMYLGRIVEYGTASQLAKPLHPYTQALVAAVPIADPRRKRKRIILPGEIPSATNPPAGCLFHPRCPHAEPRCRTEEPQLKEWQPGQWAACHLADKL